ncbi:MAG: hypothetical protein HKO62_01370, partial [Gammaproteobacteria bacterium]|nr:hypothetical protein [Gammaproteobacteria bacterium]
TGAGTAAATARLQQNHYLEWFAPTSLSVGRQAPPEIGAVVLCVGHDLA